MFGRKKKEDKLDYSTLNDVIKTSKSILKIVLILAIVSIVILGYSIIKEWEILSVISTILQVISPLFIGIVIAWLLDPAVRFLTKRGFNRVLASSVVFVLALALLVLIISLIIPSLGNQINEIINMAPQLFDNISKWFNDFMNGLAKIYNYDFSIIKENITESFNQIFKSITVDLPTTIVDVVRYLINGGINFVFGLFVAFYMLIDFDRVRKHLLAFIPKKVHIEVITLTDRLNKLLKSYVQGTLLIMLLLFIAQSIGFYLAGLKAPLVFGLFCAITNVIPYIGPYIGGIPAVIVGFIMDPLTGLFTLIAVVVCQALESYFLNPIVMSKTMKLHPVTIMVGLLIFEHFFGILGMVLSTPIIASGKVILQYFNDKYQILNMLNDEE